MIVHPPNGRQIKRAGMFPQLYHTHNSLNSEDLDFWTRLAESSCGAVLELGCGTGRVLSWLAQKKAPVYGLDHDYAMLAFFKKNTPAGLLRNVRIFQADFTRYHLGIRFDLIFLACNTYSTLSAQQRLQVLHRSYSHLVPEGVFAVSVPNPASMIRLPRTSDLEVEELFPHPADGEPVQVSSAWKRSRNQMIITWIYDHLLPDGSVDRLQYEVVQQITPVDILLGEFSSAGMKVGEIFGEFDGSPYSEDSPYLILVSTRG